MQSFIMRACAWIWDTSDLSFASMRTTAPFEVFSTFTFAFDIADMCWLHISLPDPCIEPCIDPIDPDVSVELVPLPIEPLDPVLELPIDPLDPVLELPIDPLPEPVELPLLPLALVPLPLVPVPLVPELPDCACAPTANANATTATIFFMPSSSAASSRPIRECGDGGRQAPRGGLRHPIARSGI